MPANISFDFQPSPGRARSAGEPMRLLLLGDFSGRPADQKPPLADRPVKRVDVDNLDAVLQGLAPVHEAITFAAIDHFHPDALFDRVPLFAELRSQRQQTGQQVLAAGGEDLLAGLLGGKAKAAAPATGIDALIRQVVAPHIVADTAPQQKALQAQIDAALGQAMRALLHDSHFQALEASWRGVQWLVDNLELDEDLQLHLFDIGRDELAAVGAMRHAAWGATVALFDFGSGDDDVAALAALGRQASRCGGPLLAGANKLDADSGGAAWQALRRGALAAWIGLAGPRVLLRAPYGKRSDPIERFAFDEIEGDDDSQFLWGPASLALTMLLARGGQELGELPAVTVQRDGESQLLPCARQWLDHEQAQSWLEAGVMPLLSHRQRAAVRLPRWQSIAEPPSALAGIDAAC